MNDDDALARREPSVRMRGRRRGALAWTVFALGLAAAVGARANCRLKVAEMPVTMKGSRAIATVGINGTDIPLVVDTGAFYSSLTDAAAAQLHLRTRVAPDGLRVDGLTGPMDVRVAKVGRLKLMKGEIPDVEFLVGGNDLGLGTLGLLGRNLLSMGDVEYDLAHGMIRFVWPSDECDGADPAYWAGETPVAMAELDVSGRDVAPALRATGRLNGKDVNILFDTGATTFVTLRAARRAGVAPDQMTRTGDVAGAGRGSAKAWTASFDTFELGGERIGNNRIAVADVDLDDTDMYLGIDFFLSHRIYVSRKQQRMYFTYNGGAVFALNTSAPAPEAAASDAGPALDADGYARRGAAFASRGDQVHAIADVDRAVAMAPAVAAYRVQRGMSHVALKQLTEARADFDEALRLDPAQDDALLARAALRAAAGEREGALDDLDALDKALAPQAQMRLEVARAYDALALPERALAQWDLWIASHPNDRRVPEVLNHRCWARAMLGIELDKALEDCDGALDLDGKNPSYLDSRGWVFLRLGRFSKAVDDFDRALTIRPDAPWTLYGRGIARTRLGDPAGGLADLEAARKLHPAIDGEAARHGIAVAAKAAP